MAVGDIFRTRQFIELPTSRGSVTLFARQTVNQTSGFDTESLANAIVDEMSPKLADLLSVDCSLGAVRVSKVYNESSPPHENWGTALLGTRAGTPLPSGISLILGLEQQDAGPRRNGRMFIPGISEDDTDGPTITSAFNNTQVEAFANQIVVGVVDSANNGEFEFGVINRSFLGTPPTPIEYADGFQPITGVFKNQILGRNKKRRTRVRGSKA